MRQFVVRCRAFSCEGVKDNLVMIDQDGVVWVWDEVAGHFTICHRLSPRRQREIVRLANRQK